MTTKELKTHLLGRIQQYVESVHRLLEEDKSSGHDDAYDRGCLTTYQNVMSMIENIPSGGSEPITPQLGDRYRCLQDLHYEDSDGVMFTKGNVYVVIRDNYGRLGLMDNGGLTRRYDATSNSVISTEYFQKIED